MKNLLRLISENICFCTCKLSRKLRPEPLAVLTKGEVISYNHTPLHNIYAYYSNLNWVTTLKTDVHLFPGSISELTDGDIRHIGVISVLLTNLQLQNLCNFSPVSAPSHLISQHSKIFF